MAITKDGQLIDSVSIDITAKKVTSDDEVERQNDQYHIGSWENKTPRLTIKREVAKEAISYREGANKRGNSSRLTQSFHFFMFEPIFSPVNALNQPI
ncbi:hypothetical protein [Aeromonas caviae]|uniref:hypothetical protein n=1 Tax=Aeromonas caviae TaxID=648 RepID=UPI001112CDD3|nr:hypothetical protein [Aeromonas caviae]